MRVRDKAAAPAAFAAAVATAFAGLLGAGDASAACASFWGMGNSAQCQSEVGSFAIVTHDTGSATAVGIGGAISVGGGTAFSDGLFTAALASGKNTYARAFGVGSLAQDVANDQNTGSEATSRGWFNRALNYGNNNIARSFSGPQPTVDLETGNIDIGNNTALNIGNGNGAGAGSVLSGLPGGFSNGVYQFGDGNLGVATGALSNLIQVGDDNGTWPTEQKPLALNTAIGLFTTNNVFGNRNVSNAVGNIQGALTVGDDNVNNVVGGRTENPKLPLPKLHPNLSASNVFGNENRVNVRGNADQTNVVGDSNRVGVRGNRNLTTMIGHDNKVDLKPYRYNGIRGNNNVTTSLGDDNKIGVRGDGNLTTNFGHRNRIRSFGDNNVNANAGDDQTSVKGSTDAP